MSLTVTEEQANFILGEYLKLHATTVGMHEKVHKTFAVDGRMLGDIGECVLSYAFNLKLNEKQVAGFDADTGLHRTGLKSIWLSYFLMCKIGFMINHWEM